MTFEKMWADAIASDPGWQFEEIVDELEEENPELAQAFIEYVRREDMIHDLVRRRMIMNYGIYIE